MLYFCILFRNLFWMDFCALFKTHKLETRLIQSISQLVQHYHSDSTAQSTESVKFSLNETLDPCVQKQTPKQSCDLGLAL